MDLSRNNRIRLAAAVATFAATMSALGGQLGAKEVSQIEVRIIADDMCCQGCAQKVAAQLYAAPGVTDVRTDVPKRLVKITATPSPKLTLERLWRAVEKGKGAPSKLITSEATYTLMKPEEFQPAERLSSREYLIELAEFDSADLHATTVLLRKTYNAPQINLDQSRRTLTFQTGSDESLSEWALLRLVKQAGIVPVRVAGPSGSLEIEYATESRRRTGAHQPKPGIRGDVR
jgi:copper chaperone CopZ